MVSFSIAATVATFIVAAASAPTSAQDVNERIGTFKLQACSSDGGNTSFSGQFVTLQHVGAADNLLIMTDKERDAPTFKFDKTHIFEPGTGYPLHLDQVRPQAETPSGLEPTAPKGFRSITLGGTKGSTLGFYTNTHHGIQRFSYDDQHSSVPFAEFAVCGVTGVGAFAFDANQLMWRKYGSRESREQCSDVKLFALFYDEKTGEFPEGDACALVR